MRTFVAVFFPDDITEKVFRLVENLSREAVGVKWVSKENLHMTLRFLGELGERDVEKVCEIVKRAADGTRGFVGKLSGAGAFPSLEKARVFWVGMKEGGEELVKLSEELERGLVEGGFGNADKPFKPHLTTGRAKVGKGLQRLIEKLKKTEFETDSFPIDSVCVVRSTLTPQGPIYTKLSTFKFRP